MPVAGVKIGVLPNFVMLPIAIAGHNGCADYHVNISAASAHPSLPGRLMYRYHDLVPFRSDLKLP